MGEEDAILLEWEAKEEEEEEEEEELACLNILLPQESHVFDMFA